MPANKGQSLLLDSKEHQKGTNLPDSRPVLEEHHGQPILLPAWNPVGASGAYQIAQSEREDHIERRRRKVSKAESQVRPHFHKNAWNLRWKSTPNPPNGTLPASIQASFAINRERVSDPRQHQGYSRSFERHLLHMRFQRPPCEVLCQSLPRVYWVSQECQPIIHPRHGKGDLRRCPQDLGWVAELYI